MPSAKPSMPKKQSIPARNQSPTGWWLYREIEQWVSNRQIKAKLKPGSRCLVWENTRIIKARDRNEAYAKAMRLGKECSPSKTDRGEWRFMGIAQLLPIYEDLADGAELMWEDRGMLTQTRVRTLTKPKKQLPVFDDREPRP